jgi:intergrase/recombinase
MIDTISSLGTPNSLIRGCRLVWSRLGDLGYTADVFDGFREWLLKNHHRSTVPQLFKYAQQYCGVFSVPSRASELLALNRDKRRLAMSSLANFGKHIGKYECWKMIVKNTGLKWEKKTSLEVVLDIMDSRLIDTKEWLLRAIGRLSIQHATVLVFDMLTGLRPSEAYSSCSLITELSEEGKLNQYLNKDLMMLEHFRYKDMFLRRCKNAYISFITPELLGLILENKPRLKYSSLNPKLRKHELECRVKQLRKYNGTMLREHLPTEVIDLLQGRINESIFLRYYYKPLLQDIQQRTIKALQQLQKELIETVRQKQN